MVLSTPSAEVEALMETMRIRQRAERLKALEDERIRQEQERIRQEQEDKKTRALLIEAEATIRFEIENYDNATIEGIKNKIRNYPNMHIIELRDLISGYRYCTHGYKCKSDTNCKVCGNIRYMNRNDIHSFNQQISIQKKRKEIYDEFIAHCISEVNSESLQS
jgi:phosphoribosylaminoimidazole carboxylase (NCAIR synthetase)